ELSDRMPAIAQLLARNGYTPYHRELQLSCDLGRAAPTQTTPPGVDLRQQAREQAHSFALYAMSGENKAGECHYITLAHMLGPHTRHTGYIAWLHVEPDSRRRGIGRYLMVQALDHLRRMGCASCWLTTSADNWPAQPL